MAAEMRAIHGAVGRRLGDQTVGDGQWAVSGDGFLLRAPGGIGLGYRRGAGVRLEAPADADPRDIELWRNGTLYAAVAAFNGLFPLHASAVAYQGRVYAFAGPQGAGKSTLVAALGRRGFAQVCDDTLILDPAGTGAPQCLPGHKRLKLWSDGAALAGVETGEQVAADYAKRFIDPAGGAVTRALPLAELIVLAEGARPSFTPLAGGARIAALEDDHYTAQLWRLIQDKDRAGRFAMLAALARRFAISRFARPFDPARFEEALDCAVAHIEARQ